MKNYGMHHSVRKVRIYKDAYRPSTNLSHFLRTLLSIIWAGKSPITK